GEVRAPWPGTAGTGANSVPGRAGTADLRERIAAGLAGVDPPPDHVDQRIPVDSHRSSGAQVPGRRDGEVLLRQRLAPAGRLQAAGVLTRFTAFDEHRIKRFN